MASFQDIFECVGHTPTFPLRRLSEAAGAELLVKAEHLNPGGSIKDRVALAMIEAAEADATLRPGMTITEATAGNTGIGLAWIAAARGYRFVSVMTEADRGPKTEAMEAMGAEVVLLPHGLQWDSDEGPLGVAGRIATERGGVFVNQFSNAANPEVHERTTGAEILAEAGSGIDAVVLGIGTGGTVTGVGRALRKAGSTAELVGVVADGSYLSDGESRIAGITPDFEPEIFDTKLVDRIESVSAEDAAEAARRLARLEGVPAGHSGGAGLVAAERIARRRPGARVLFLVGDSARNYPELCGTAP